MQAISLGKHNPKLLDIRKAFDHGALTREGLLPVEGPKLLWEAQRSGLHVAAIFLRRGAELRGAELNDIPANVPVYTLDPSAFKRIQSTESSQGLIALVAPRRFGLAELIASRPDLVVVLARLQDPGNIGTILRVAESFEVDACLATTGTASAINPKAVRASAGSVFRLPHVWDLNLKELAEALRTSGVAIVGTSPAAQEAIDAWDWRKPSAIVIGNEGGGLNAEEISVCDVVLRIPLKTDVESLNSAVAAAITLYEASKQRRTR